MSAAESFENHIFDIVHQAIDRIPADDAPDVYALSFWIYADEDDPRRQIVDFNYNTLTHVEESKPDASDENEAKWNFAFWLQNEVALVGNEADTAGAQVRAAWLNERGLNYTDEEEESDSDRCEEIAEQIDDEFRHMCARVGKRLHDAGIITSKFGRPIPIIIHSLEYDDTVSEITGKANPSGLAADFGKWIDEM